jgi:hypothetical protein
MTPKRKRGYSRRFPSGSSRQTKNYLLVGIPIRLWRDLQTQAERQGLSIRTYILERLTVDARLTRLDVIGTTAGKAMIETSAPTHIHVRPKP